MNDRDLILQALTAGAPPKRVRKRVKPIFGDSFDVGADAIFNPKKLGKATKRERTIEQWKGSDFVKYFTKCLAQLGVSIETNIRDSDWVMKVYDRLVTVFGGNMNNYVLRDYIDWWVGTYAAVRADRELGVFSLNKDMDIDRFVKHYALRAGKPQQIVKPIKINVEMSSAEMYKLSGLTMVLMEHGIVEAYKVLVDNGEAAVFVRLSDALRKCSKDAVKSIMDTTLSKQYSPKYLVDFISVARPTLKFHGLEKQFDCFNYKDYFMEAVTH